MREEREQALKFRKAKLANFKLYIEKTGIELTPEWAERLRAEEDLIDTLEIELLFASESPAA